MGQQRLLSLQGRHISLSLRVSVLLALAAILPLVITVIIIEMIAQPTLIAQNSRAMAADAQTHTQLIDNFFAERTLAAEALSRLTPIQNFLQAVKEHGPISVDLKDGALNSLRTGHGRGSYYENWTLLDLAGNPQLSYPNTPFPHGSYYILPGNLANVQPDSQGVAARKSIISGVFYNPVSNEAYIDIYTPVTRAADYVQLGILRSTFDLHYIWDIVNQEAGTNGAGSYAFILDQYGVFIAHTNAATDPFSPTHSLALFNTITPLPNDVKTLVRDGDLYGARDQGDLPVIDNAGLAGAQKSTDLSASFQFVPPGQSEPFQVVHSQTYTVPWTYYVASPLRVQTAVADNQLRITALLTIAIIILAAIIGLAVGQRITAPILRSVELLRNSSQALKTLAAKEQGAATQQMWVIDSANVGLRTVQYYTKAAEAAIQHHNTISSALLERQQAPDLGEVQQGLEQLLTDGQYVERAIGLQNQSNRKLASTIKINTQVADQLATSASAATQAADQLEQVVDELRQVVGQ